MVQKIPDLPNGPHMTYLFVPTYSHLSFLERMVLFDDPLITPFRRGCDVSYPVDINPLTEDIHYPEVVG